MTKFRPYSKWPLPDMSKHFKIANGSIETYNDHFFGKLSRLTGSHTITEQTSVNAQALNIAGYGTITVSTQGTTDTYPNIKEGSAFIGAIQREQRHIKEEKIRIYEAENPWHKGLNNNDLKDTSIIIPKQPDMLNYISQGIDGKVFRYYMDTLKKHNYKSGDWVQKGDILVSLPPGKMVAPCSGKIQYVAGYMKSFQWDEALKWPTDMSGGFQAKLKDTALVIIQPLKSEAVSDRYVAEAYAPMIEQDRESIRKLSSLSDKQIRKNYHNLHLVKNNDLDTDKIRNSLISFTNEAIRLVEEAGPHFVVGGPAVDLPEWPDKEWIEKNAPNSGVSYTP